MGFPRYLGKEGVAAFAESLIEESGVLVLPGTIYSTHLGEMPSNHFRIGYGRTGLDEGISAMEAHVMKNKR